MFYIALFFLSYLVFLWHLSWLEPGGGMGHVLPFVFSLLSSVGLMVSFLFPWGVSMTFWLLASWRVNGWYLLSLHDVDFTPLLISSFSFWFILDLFSYLFFVYEDSSFMVVFVLGYFYIQCIFCLGVWVCSLSCFYYFLGVFSFIYYFSTVHWR